MKRSKGEKIFNIFNILFFLLIAVIMLIPVLAVLKESFDLSPPEVRLNLIPAEFTTLYYEMIFSQSTVYRPFLNSVWVTVVGTFFSVFLNSMGAYTLSRRELRGNRFFIYFLVIIPMVVGGGGMVAEYLLMKWYGLYDRFAVLIVPLLADGWQMVLIRQFYWTIPFSLTESAEIDGAPEFLIFRQIILPLAKPVIAAMALFTGVGFWNRWFNALIYIQSPAKWTFPVKLRSMLFLGQDDQILFEKMAMEMGIDVEQMLVMFEHLSSAMIFVAMIPVIIAYPYMQKHFAKGIRVGAVKG